MNSYNDSTNYKHTKESNIRNLLFLLKLSALFIASIPIYHKYSIQLSSESTMDYYSSFIFTLLAFVIIGLLLLLWTAVEKNKNDAFIRWVELPTLMTLYTFSIYCSNGSCDSYKFLYIILIITYTIQFGQTMGFILALLSAVLVILPRLFSSGYPSSFETDLANILLFVIVALTLGYYVKMEQTHIEYLTNMANIDSLTGIFNHRYFHEYLAENYTTNTNNQKPLSLILIDVDFFKEFNDVLGHLEGDHLLQTIVSIMREELGNQGTLFRYGGDEFCIILDGVTGTQALQIGEHLRSIIHSYSHDGMEHLPGKRLSVSMGIASLDDDISSYMDLIEKADTALYRAKYLRKNRVEVYGSIWRSFKELSSSSTDDVLKYVKTLLSIIDSKDKYTYSHIERVAHYCELFANYIDLPYEDKKNLIYGGYFHDLGKLNISKDILISDQPLTKEEWDELKMHPVESAAIIEKIDGFHDVIPIVKYHHEKYDGTGYPEQLCGEEIPYLSRILTVIDSYDAMTHKRPYQRTKTVQQALDELERCKHTHFDPQLVDAFVAMMKKTQ